MPSLALILTTYNRPELLTQCLDSLSRADLTRVGMIIIHDDASTDERTLEEIKQFIVKCKQPLTFLRQPDNRGIKNALQTCFKMGFINHDLCCNIDADVIVKPDFINVLLSLKEQLPKGIVSGFNCDNKQNPITGKGDWYVLRKHCNGINMLMDKEQYERIIKPALSAPGNWDYNSTHDIDFVIACPSQLQHIGATQSTMGHTNGDVACDFKLLSLPNVSLFGIDAHDPAGIRRAADICTRDVEFAGVKIITERLFSGREAYSKFMIKDLYEHVKDLPGTHVLTIHADGYVQRPEAWSDEFLQYDFIGASWLYKDGLNVGNGGFSLRSKKFIEACSNLDITDFHPEDCKLARKYRPYLEEQGITYAPVEIADRFSIEAYGCSIMTDSEGVNAATYCGSFGFHGAHVKGLPQPMKPVHKPVVNRPVPRSATLRNRQTRFR